MAPFLRAADMHIAARNLYRGLLRLLLVLLHDFPEFLSEYYFTLCDAIPPRCVQLRNIVLSAYPPACILPDPHLTSIKLESLPEMGPIPAIQSDFTFSLRTGELRTLLDQCLLNRVTTPSLTALMERLRSGSTTVTGETYNLTIVNAVVMYIGVSSVAQAKARSGSALFAAGDPGVVTLAYLARNLDPEGEYSSFVLCIVGGFLTPPSQLRSTPSRKRHCATAPLPERAHPLVLFSLTSLICGD
jgi:CCR4-NOT transcription complex subunit 1